jgi:hypothetical protein
MIDTYNIDYIVQDGEDMVKVCSKSSHTHNLHDSNYANSVHGLDHVIGQIRTQRPHIILENCAGKNPLEVLLINSDISNGFPIPHQVRDYQAVRQQL